VNDSQEMIALLQQTATLLSQRAEASEQQLAATRLELYAVQAAKTAEAERLRAALREADPSDGAAGSPAPSRPSGGTQLEALQERRIVQLLAALDVQEELAATRLAELVRLQQQQQQRLAAPPAPASSAGAPSLSSSSSAGPALFSTPSFTLSAPSTNAAPSVVGSASSSSSPTVAPRSLTMADTKAVASPGMLHEVPLSPAPVPSGAAFVTPKPHTRAQQPPAVKLAPRRPPAQPSFFSYIPFVSWFADDDDEPPSTAPGAKSRALL
jgi:hypothetical protein